MTVRFRDEALEDLEEIAGYIARDNPAAASSVIARIHDVIYGTLAVLPQSGHAAHGAHEMNSPSRICPTSLCTNRRTTVSILLASSTPRCIPKANAAGCIPDERRPAPQPRFKDSEIAPSMMESRIIGALSNGYTHNGKSLLIV